MAVMIEFAKMISVLLGAIILGNWFLSEFKKTRLQKLPWYAAYLTTPGLLVLAALSQIGLYRLKESLGLAFKLPALDLHRAVGFIVRDEHRHVTAAAGKGYAAVLTACLLQPFPAFAKKCGCPVDDLIRRQPGCFCDSNHPVSLLCLLSETTQVSGFGVQVMNGLRPSLLNPLYLSSYLKSSL